MYPLGRKQKFFSRNVLLFSPKYETSTTASSYAVGLYLHDSIESGGFDFSKAAVLGVIIGYRTTALFPQNLPTVFPMLYRNSDYLFSVRSGFQVPLT